MQAAGVEQEAVVIGYGWRKRVRIDALMDAVRSLEANAPRTCGTHRNAEFEHAGSAARRRRLPAVVRFDPRGVRARVVDPDHPAARVGERMGAEQRQWLVQRAGRQAFEQRVGDGRGIHGRSIIGGDRCARRTSTGWH